MTHAFLETGQHGLLVAGVDVDDAIRGETDLGQGRREQILPGDAPQDLALGPRRDAGREQSRRGAVDGGVAAAGDLVQRPERQPATRQSVVDSLDPEREHSPGAQRHTLKALNLLAKPQDGGWLDRSTHALVKRFQDWIVLDLFVTPSKSQSAAPVPGRRFHAEKRGSRCDHEGNHGVLFFHTRTIDPVQPAAAYLDSLNPEQRRAVEHGAAGPGPFAPLLVIAGAGSGKTNTLAHRVAHLIVNGADPRRIRLDF